MKSILEEKYKINYLSLYLKKLQKEELIKHEGGRIKDSIKMKIKIKQKDYW